MLNNLITRCGNVLKTSYLHTYLSNKEHIRKKKISTSNNTLYPTTCMRKD